MIIQGPFLFSSAADVAITFPTGVSSWNSISQVNILDFLALSLSCRLGVAPGIGNKHVKPSPKADT